MLRQVTVHVVDFSTVSKGRPSGQWQASVDEGLAGIADWLTEAGADMLAAE